MKKFKHLPVSLQMLSIPEETRQSILNIRRFLPSVHWQSDDYKKLIREWRKLCRLEIKRLRPLSTSAIVFSFSNADMIASAWRKLFEICPSGSPEETYALSVWQNWMPEDDDLEQYRERVRREGEIVARLL